MNAFANAAVFQVGWFACVLSVSNRVEILALVSVALIIATHVYLVKNWYSDIQIILSAGVIGLIVDSTMISHNIFAPSHEMAIEGLAPLWLIGLWMLFGTTINHSLVWFRNHLLLAAIAGFVFAPLAYWAGYKFDVLNFPDDYVYHISLFAVGICWFFITPFLIWLSQLINHKSDALQIN